jgi:DNA topoisomerase-1
MDTMVATNNSNGNSHHHSKENGQHSMSKYSKYDEGDNTDSSGDEGDTREQNPSSPEERPSSRESNWSDGDSEEDRKKSKKKKRKHSSSDEDFEAAPKKKVKKEKKDKSSKEEKKKKKKDKDKVKVKEERDKSVSKSAKKEKKSKSKVKKEAATEVESPVKGKKKKKEENTEHVWKWWEEIGQQDSSVKWNTLSHNGPVFAPAYDPLPANIRFRYNGQVMKLSESAEEVATFYARMLDHEYTSKKIFNDNFFHDWQKFMTKDEKRTITKLELCDFVEMSVYFKEQTELRKTRTKEEKLESKLAEQKLRDEYGCCLVDGHKQLIGNFKIEPPGLFRGRGEHPKMGKVKVRVLAGDVIINIGKEANVPKPPPGHKWKEVRHDNTVTWLACWTENIMGSVKYIMLNPTSKLKSQKDWQKYEKARDLKKCVNQIRTDYSQDFKAREMVRRQRAVALYFIDRLALRAGNEKEEGETADTVGCCSLRFEHIKLHSEKNKEKYVVDFDFLGKDSIRYQNSVSVEKKVFKNLKLFMENKNVGDDLFDRLNTASLNKYLNSIMDGLTAKVFRTYNASQTLQEQLDQLTEENSSLEEKMLSYNRANRAVAILCNHQRSVPKTFDKSMESLQSKIEDKQKTLKLTKKEAKEAKKSGDKKQLEKLQKKQKTLEQQLKKLELAAVDKEENKQIALGTSKLNYLDPRISIAW